MVPVRFPRWSGVVKRRKRTYPFTESVPMTSSTATNSARVVLTDMRVTTYKTNPFHGIDRVVFAVDEWGHRHLPQRLHRLALGWLCDWWDNRLLPFDDGRSAAAWLARPDGHSQ